MSRSLGKLEWDPPSEEPAGGHHRGRDPSDTTDAAADSLDAAVDDSAPCWPTREPPVEDVAEPGPDAAGITSDAAFFRLASNDLLAAETQDYVPKLIAAAIIAKAPERYGFSGARARPLHLRLAGGARRHRARRRRPAGGVESGGDPRPQPQYLRLATPPAVHDGDPRSCRHRRGRGRALRIAEPKARVHYLTLRHHSARAAQRRSPRAITCRCASCRWPTPSSRPRVRPRVPALVIPTVAVPSALAMKATGTVGPLRRSYASATTHRVRRGETLYRHRPEVPGVGQFAPPRERLARRSRAPCRDAPPHPGLTSTFNRLRRDPVSADSSAPAPVSTPAAPAAPLSERAAFAVLGSMLFLIVALAILLAQTTWIDSASAAEPPPRPTAAVWRSGDRAAARSSSPRWFCWPPARRSARRLAPIPGYTAPPTRRHLDVRLVGRRPGRARRFRGVERPGHRLPVAPRIAAGARAPWRSPTPASCSPPRTDGTTSLCRSSVRSGSRRSGRWRASAVVAGLRGRCAGPAVVSVPGGRRRVRDRCAWRAARGGRAPGLAGQPGLAWSGPRSAAAGGTRRRAGGPRAARRDHERRRTPTRSTRSSGGRRGRPASSASGAARPGGWASTSPAATRSRSTRDG